MASPAFVRVTLHHNARRAATGAVPDSLNDAAASHRIIRQLPDYRPTPAVDLPGLARRLGVDRVTVKDEGRRFGLGSFKAAGAGYAIYRQVAQRVAAATGRLPDCTELLSGSHAGITREMTLVCASAGNHGRAVAWAARLFHCRARVYISETVPEPGAAAIRREGGEVIRVTAGYDECVRLVAAEARRHGWLVISDTAYAEYREIPIDIMRGYTILVDEYMSVRPLPTHVFVQAGVGGLAAAVAAAFPLHKGRRRPRIITVEPDQAACIAAGVARGTYAEVGPADSIMTGLACGVPSTVAWEILSGTISASVTIPDPDVLSVRQLLGVGMDGDPPLHGGPSGCAGVAALIGCAMEPAHRLALGLDDDAHVLAFLTEAG